MFIMIPGDLPEPAFVSRVISQNQPNVTYSLSSGSEVAEAGFLFVFGVTQTQRWVSHVGSPFRTAFL
jgi:hypothetical protein